MINQEVLNINLECEWFPTGRVMKPRVIADTYDFGELCPNHAHVSQRPHPRVQTLSTFP